MKSRQPALLPNLAAPSMLEGNVTDSNHALVSRFRDLANALPDRLLHEQVTDFVACCDCFFKAANETNDLRRDAVERAKRGERMTFQYVSAEANSSRLGHGLKRLADPLAARLDTLGESESATMVRLLGHGADYGVPEGVAISADGVEVDSIDGEWHGQRFARNWLAGKPILATLAGRLANADAAQSAATQSEPQDNVRTGEAAEHQVQIERTTSNPKGAGRKISYSQADLDKLVNLWKDYRANGGRKKSEFIEENLDSIPRCFKRAPEDYDHTEKLSTVHGTVCAALEAFRKQKSRRIK